MKFWKSLVVVFMLYICFFSIYVAIVLEKPLKIHKDIEVYIPKGASFYAIASTFKDKGLIKDEHVFIIAGKLLGIEKKARAGYYLITKDMTMLDILKKLLEGRIIEYKLTVIEGDSLYEIADKLAQINPEFKQALWNLATDPAFLSSMNIQAPSIEGYLFPSVYEIPKGMNINEILTMMIKKFWQVYNEELRKQTEKMGWTVNEVVTLASIIEKEAKVEEEKPLISAVYHNRLRIGMPLQADPTAIYGVKRYKTGVTKKDLKNKSPYNTYIIKKLPPGPIACPGLKSILAALYPAKVPYLYFVSKGDGTHEFSVDYQAHISAINMLRGNKSDE
ncbi:MAG TPA: endolytic transglycosylase MltG [Thermodesulfovibrio thiophilus]|uniref:endolytic transglycosylase MltG n=1 Tax=Thermodesulfovibrio thiophilus TaxID=340095 RepID=UPI0003FD6229|nr:endolytic transglycosylase MltG [Thermodesulfovibrio thiophilus]HOA83380.1 endolytic transglycosylase MltG [Thermodesulfovibrio thiophilus]HQA03856.1 endolytic transglycosylase MltG [Thermodesulfovibrio thiophilus]HQD36411.1 endolytic transglycosylase MltG [Thermodesulfovibrio thiophilus]